MAFLRHKTTDTRARLLLTRLHGHAGNLFVLRAEGVRTALAVLLPLVIGQIAGYAAVGLMAGLGGLYVSVAEKEGSTWRTMLFATLGAACAAFAASLIGGNYALSVMSMFLIAFAGGMLAVYGIVVGQLGFVVTMVFAVILGLPAPLRTAGERCIEFGVGGLWGTLLTVLMWRITARNEAREERGQGEQHSGKPGTLSIRQKWHRRWRKMRRNLTPRSEVFQHSVRLAFIAALAVALNKFLRLEHGAWLTLTVLIIVKPDYYSTRTRASERLIGTLIGGILALFLSALIHNIFVIDALLLCLSVLAYSHLQQNYALYTVFLTPFVVLLLNIAAPGDTKLALVRVTDTLVGGALALFMAYLLRPRRRNKK